MLKDIQWPEDRTYESNSKYNPLSFYLNCLQNSKTLYLRLGYFSSSAINLLSLGFANFISKGGEVHLIINHFLSEIDKKLVSGEQHTEQQFDLQNPIKLQKQLSKYDEHFFDCLSYLIKEKRLSFTVIKPKGSNGIAHYKDGLFYDGKNYVGYTGSCNFTLSGLIQNLESLRVDLDWDGGPSSRLIKKILEEIQITINKQNEAVEYLNSEDIIEVIQQCSSNPHKDINELLITENHLLETVKNLDSNEFIKESIEKIEKENQEIAYNPRFPYPSGPREYQIQAYNKWLENNKKGIFAMATGTGKTITALNCLLQEYLQTGIYQAVILVPTTALLYQWKEECSKFQFKSVLLASIDKNWEEKFYELTSSIYGNNNSYIVIATYASFQKGKFSQLLPRFSNNTLLIADEAHNIGGPGMRKMLDSIPFKKRIGLSATPERIYDEEGEKDMLSFFNDSYPYIYQYTMKKAIENGVLCRYYYYPRFVTLNSIEQESYNELSERISKIYLQLKYSSDKHIKQELEKQIKFLLLTRKRIIHQANNKAIAFKEILSEIIKDDINNLKYTLVYAPEGNEDSENDELDLKIYEEKKQELEIESQRFIDSYTKIITGIHNRVLVSQYTSSTKNRTNLLKKFSSGNIDVLISMKCLDEGVDVPQARQAIFCSSTGNPRQFIQRRGRILRKHKSKEFAYIYDLVVFPEIQSSLTFDTEKKLIISELKRVANFASLAENYFAIKKQLTPILEKYDISFNDLTKNNEES